MKLIGAAAAALALSATAALAQPASPAPDYAQPETWLCRPGRDDACAQDLTTTVVSANGAMRRERFRPARNPQVDCFYVYPTVSNDPTPNSDLTANDEERFVIANQAARFAAKCRVFAPLYRQVTLTALREGMAGRNSGADRAMAMADVKAAWAHYLAHDNGGRGVVLIGHSQGAGLLTGLLATEIDGKPVQRQLVSALILGSNVPVTRGQTTGGVLRTIPLCTSADQAGCVVAFVSFRDTVPPPPNARFGAPVLGVGAPPLGDNLAAACVNPAALLRGGESAPLHSYLAARGRAFGAGADPAPWAAGKTVTTPFVSMPGLLSARCVSTPTHTYLSVTVNGNAQDPRTDDIPGDVVVAGQVLPDWGLHLIDVNLAMGDLVTLVGRQAAAWKKAQPR